MRAISLSFLVVLGGSLRQAAATGWLDAASFSCPSNTNNRCNVAQKQGYKWSGLPNGEFGTYGGLDFSGFHCVDSFDKRDHLIPRTFQSKCIKAPVGKTPQSGPKISCDSRKSFSIDEFQISSSVDTDVVLIFGYENGDVCKHTASCSKGGSTIKNSQCGGATSVTFQLPTHSEHESCDLGIHSVSFDCGPPISPPKTSSIITSPLVSIPISSVPESSPPLSTTYSIPKGNFSITAGTTVTPVTSPATTPGTSVTTPVASSVTTPLSSSTTTPVASDSTPVVSSATTPLVSSKSVPLVTAGSSSPVSGIHSTPAVNGTYIASYRSSSITTQELVTTEIVHTTLTTCPVTSTVTSGANEIVKTSSTVSTIYSTSISTICTKCVAPPSPTPTVSTQELVTTEIIHTTLTTCPITSTITSGASKIVETTSTISTIYSTSTSTICTKCVAPPSPQTTATTQEVVTTVITTASITVCPVTQTLTSAGIKSVSTGVTTSTIFNTVTSTICTKCIVPAATPIPSVIENSSSVPVTSSSLTPVPAPAPHILPKCLNTWITLTQCKDNADSDCYCKDSSFTKNVQDCVCSWTEDDSTIQAALSYLAGICAPHVSENPGVVTHVPKTITLVPIPAATPLQTAPPASQPVTTISIVKTLSLPYTYPAGGPSAGQTISSSFTISIYSTQVTVPQVQFTTESPIAGASGVPNVGLAAGSPAPAPATPTSIYPPGGVYAPGVGTTFSTGAFRTGQFPVNPSTLSFKGGAGRLGTSIVGAAVMGLVGLLVVV